MSHLRPVHVAVLVALAACAVLGVRLGTVCDGEIECMVLAGDRFTDPVVSGLPAEPGDGYDGQFLWRQARSPLNVDDGPVHGVTFDNEVRSGRVGYPAAAWVLSAGGQRAAVPWAMAALEVLSLAAIGWVLTVAARRADRSPWWGLAATAVPGLWFAAGRLLADPFVAALVGAGALALMSRRWRWAALLFSVAVLTKEQAVIVPAAFGLWRLWELWRARGDATAGAARAGAAELAWVVPGVVFVAWQALLWARTGSIPALEAGGTHAVVPGVDLVPAVISWLVPSGVSEVLWLVELVAFGALGLVVLAARSSTGWERVVAAAAIVFVAILNDNVFVDPAHFRQLGDLSVVLLIAALRAPVRWWAPIVGANVLATLGVAGRLFASL